jgi:hypothetical protein
MKRLINFAPLTIRLSRLPRVSFPMLGIDATIDAVFTSIRRAICLAYFEPFTVHRGPAVRVTDFDLDGRDPNW